MERIHVTVRARPLSAEDAKTSPWLISGNSISNPNSSSKFEFDRVFREGCKTSEVYQSRTKDLVSAAVRGTVFAFGQTNSWKTYTIRGSATEPGVIRLVVRDLFDLIQQMKTLEESKLEQQKMEGSIKMLAEEKEELALKLTDTLLEMEEERAIWSSKEKASIEAIEDKAQIYKKELGLFSEEMLEARNELEFCRQECKALKEKMLSYEETRGLKACSLEKSFDVDHLHNDQDKFDLQRKQSEELLLVVKEKDELITRIQEQNKHVSQEIWHKQYNDLLVEELTGRISNMEVKVHSDGVENSMNKAKLRIRLRGTLAKLDAFRYRYKEAEDEINLINRKFEEASGHQKDRLALKGVEVLNLKKQLASKG